MLKYIFKNYIYPIAALVGGIVGVGFLSLPYITLRVGVWPMLFYFVGLTVLVSYLHVIFAEISLKTPDYKRWPGFVGFYLGRFSKVIILITMTLGILGVMLVYLIVGSEFLSVVFIPIFGGSALSYTLLYFLGVSVFVYFGVRTISRVDFLALSSLLLILLFIIIKGFFHIRFGNINIPVSVNFFSDWKTMFLPYGAIVFSLWGAGFIPEIEEMIPSNKKSLKKIVILSTLITAVFYIVFTFLVLGITGPATTESALVGLKIFLGGPLTSIALLIGVITTFIASIAEGLLLKKVFMYDMGIKEIPAWILVSIIPLALFLLGFNSFIPIISFIGGFFLSIDGILIMVMYRKIGGRKIIAYPLILVFVLGIIYQIIYFVN